MSNNKESMIPKRKNKQKVGRPPSGKSWMVPITVYFDEIDLAKLDRARGLADRSKYIRQLIVTALRS